MNWNFWKPKPKRAIAPSVKPAAPYRRGWTGQSFKETQVYVDALREFLSGPVGQAALSAMYSDLPKGYSTLEHGANQQLGRINGYCEAINKLEWLAEPLPDRTKDIQETWGVDQSQLEEQQTETT